MADSLSMAFLVVMESLSPAERAVFLLHEVFGYEHKEIAEITGASVANSRQVLARARRHIDEGKPRFEASRAQRQEVARRFFDAADGGDLDGLLRALAPDVVYYGDGGGKARAIATPMHGRDRVARFLTGLFRRIRKLGGSIRIVEVNGQPGAVTYGLDGRVANVFALDIVDGAVQARRLGRTRAPRRRTPGGCWRRCWARCSSAASTSRWPTSRARRSARDCTPAAASWSWWCPATRWPTRRCW
jgi:RNA polymerase sigma-70 factor (ECF subfamily)